MKLNNNSNIIPQAQSNVKQTDDSVQTNTALTGFILRYSDQYIDLSLLI